jgi:hypothetical protein
MAGSIGSFNPNYAGGADYGQLYSLFQNLGRGLPGIAGAQTADQISAGYNQTPWAPGGAGEANAQNAWSQLMTGQGGIYNAKKSLANQILQGNIANQVGVVNDYTGSALQDLANRFQGVSNQFGAAQNQVGGIQNQFGGANVDLGANQVTLGNLGNKFGAEQNVLGNVANQIQTANIQNQINNANAGLFGGLLNLGLGTANDLLGGSTPGLAGAFSNLIGQGGSAIAPWLTEELGPIISGAI